MPKHSCLPVRRINVPTFICKGDHLIDLSLAVLSLDCAAQSYSIRILSAFDQLVVLTKLWLNDAQKCPVPVKVDEGIKQEIKNLGGYLQLLLQVKYITEFICAENFSALMHIYCTLAKKTEMSNACNDKWTHLREMHSEGCISAGEIGTPIC